MMGKARVIHVEWGLRLKAWLSKQSENQDNRADDSRGSTTEVLDLSRHVVCNAAKVQINPTHPQQHADDHTSYDLLKIKKPANNIVEVGLKRHWNVEKLGYYYCFQGNSQEIP